MKQLFAGLASFVVIVAVTPASAADASSGVRTYTKVPPAVSPVYDWNGFYLGANAGYGQSRKCFDVVAFSNAPIAALHEGCHDATGGVAGAQFGYRWQSNGWVFGLEAQASGANLTGRSTSAATAGASPATARASMPLAC